ncbi:hypothetical protein [Dyadobacter sp. 32]|uniref:hypothetical protein n=1 Tax=Dyadobacter sp. 32 TaxID=538966 RepID=UPI0011EC0664
MEINHHLLKSLLYALTSFITATSLMAQDMSKTYVLSEFKKASEVIPFNERFQFENFTKGYVTKQSGAKSEVRLNYSYLYGDILFIGPAFDTLSISDAHLVKNVTIGENRYLYDQRYGFVEILAEYDGVKVGKKCQMVFKDFNNRVRFERLESFTAKPGQNTFIGMPGKVNVANLTNVRLKPEIDYFLIDKNNRFHTARRESVTRIFAKSRKNVLNYLDSHAVDYKNEADLKNVIEYCANLESSL